MIKAILVCIIAIFALAFAVPLGTENKKVLRFGVHALIGENHDSELPNIVRIARMQRQKANSS